MLGSAARDDRGDNESFPTQTPSAVAMEQQQETAQGHFANNQAKLDAKKTRDNDLDAMRNKTNFPKLFLNSYGEGEN